MNSFKNKKSILVSAYGCEPLKGSEPGVGWNWILQMAKQNTLHVITRANNEEVISENLPSEIASNITFHYYDTPQLIRKLKNKDKGLYLYYFCWQMGIIPLIKKLTGKYNFDYTMHLTFGSMWMPTFLPLFRIPFIWGPVGGGDCEPLSFLKSLPLKQRIMLLLRYTMNATSIINPFILIPSWRAKAVIARTPNSAKVIPKVFRTKTRILLETAMEEDIFRYSKNQKTSDTLRLITTGRLVASKNTISCIKSLALLSDIQKIHLTIIGSGPEKAQIEKEIVQHKLNDKVTLIANTTREEVLKHLSESDIYLFPSLREGGSWALMEAMAIGLPVICLNWSGMAITTTDKCAIQLPVSSPEQMPRDMADAIRKLIVDTGLRQKLGIEGRKHIQTHFNWAYKGVFMQDLLKELDKEM